MERNYTIEEAVKHLRDGNTLEFDNGKLEFLQQVMSAAFPKIRQRI